MKTKNRRTSSNISTADKAYKSAERATPQTTLYGTNKMLSGLEKQARDARVRDTARITKKFKSKKKK